MKKMLSILLAMLMVLSLTACGSKDSGNTDAQTPVGGEDSAKLLDEPLTFKFACSEAAETSYVKIMTAAFEEITEKTNGELQFEIFASNTLGTIAETIEQMQAGAPLIVSSGTAEIGDLFCQTLSISALPYAFQDMSEIITLADSDWHETYVDPELIAAGIQPVCYGTQGYRHFASNFPIYSAADMKGKIVRMGPSASSQNLIAVMNGNPTTSTWSDNYSLLQTGNIDACEATLELMYNSGLHEVCDYLSLSGHIAGAFMCSMSTDDFNKIPAAYQTIMLDTLKDAMVDIYEAAVEAESEYVEKWREAGVEVIEPDKASFAEYVPTLIESLNYNVEDYNVMRAAIEGAK